MSEPIGTSERVCVGRWSLLAAGLLSLPAPATAQAEQVYFGILHSHTSYSDGSGTPSQAYQHARDVAHLDFLAITEHNHHSAESGASADRRDGVLIATTPSLYTGPQPEALIPTARAFSQDGQFIALYGQEFSSISKGNHVNVFEVDEVIDVPNGEFDHLVDWMNAHPDGAGHPPILQLNHPSLLNDASVEYGADDFGSTAEWVATMGRFASLIEILNGPAMAKDDGNRPAEVMESDFLQYLNLGFHVAPTGDQDNHYPTWGTVTDTRTAVIAPALTRADLLDALRQRRVYATEDRNLELIVQVNGQPAGSIVPPPATGSLLAITVGLHDPDEPAATYEITIFTDAGPGGAVAQPADVFTFHGDTSGGQPYRLEGIRFQSAGQYLFLKIRQVGEDGQDDLAWTAPVWFETGAGPAPGPQLPRIRMASLLPNPAGDERQNEEVTLRNPGTAAVNLHGWKLQDKSGKTWSLDALGSLGAGAQKTIRRNGQAMNLNNDGDTITLLDPNGAMVQSVTYPAVSEGERFSPP